MVFNLSRSTVSCIAWVVICNSLFIFEVTYRTSNLFRYDVKNSSMAKFTSCRQFGSNAVWRTCLSKRTQASGTTTNRRNSFLLNNARDRNVTFTLQCSYASHGQYTPLRSTNKQQQTLHPRYHSYNGLPNCHRLQTENCVANAFDCRISL